MIKKEYSTAIQEQIQLWEKRVYYPNLKFKEGTPADLDFLSENLTSYALKDRMLILASETPGCVYKIGRFIIESGVKNDRIAFIDGDAFLPYMESNPAYRWKAKQLIDDFIETIRNDVKSKWVVIPELNIEWEKEIAIYFIARIKTLGIYGLLFYSSKNISGNLAETLVEETYINVLQFPKARYTPKKEKDIEEDEY